MIKCYAGLDWASRSHAVCVIDARGSVRSDFEVTHDAAGLAELCRRLKAAHISAVAIERPSGLVVDALVEAGLQVVPIHPNAVKATRPRYRSHGGKSDACDAYLLADLLRTDGHRFKPLMAQGDEIRALRALVRGRDDLVATRVQLANQLRALLESFWPGAAEIFAEIDSPIALAFVQRYPTPESAARLGPKRLAAFCAQHAYCGRRSPEELLARLHQAAAVALQPLEMDAKGELVASIARVLERLVEQIRLLTSRIEHAVRDSADGQLIMSFPRAGRVCAAQILAELGSVRERFDSVERLAAEAGVTPVTYESGKTKAVAFRWACNHRLRAAITCLADNSRHASAWAAHVYQTAKARGCDHPHAIRILARAWLRVIWRAWQDRTTYDPLRHTAAMLHLASVGG
ncbi:IS110 family transposase [Variovorax sp. JS1663]|uniref:IS110 family transposase n=1 Tax=Variovorax sp. JS1663 TaxID=1851577 RepID=UPI000B712616|nr:IS110 family transposase [Variovorax sp. JS1663]OUM03732.1 transposase [Variovorax sp. JS1663]